MVSPPPSDRRGREGDSKKSGERRRRVVLEETHGSRRLLIIPVGKEKKKKNSFCTGCAPEGEIGGEKQFCFHGFFSISVDKRRRKDPQFSRIFTPVYSAKSSFPSLRSLYKNCVRFWKRLSKRANCLCTPWILSLLSFSRSTSPFFLPPPPPHKYQRASLPESKKSGSFFGWEGEEEEEEEEEDGGRAERGPPPTQQSEKKKKEREKEYFSDPAHLTHATLGRQRRSKLEKGEIKERTASPFLFFQFGSFLKYFSSSSLRLFLFQFSILHPSPPPPQPALFFHESFPLPLSPQLQF